MDYPVSDTSALLVLKNAIPYLRFTDQPEITDGQAYTRLQMVMEAMKTIEASLDEVRKYRLNSAK